MKDGSAHIFKETSFASNRLTGNFRILAADLFQNVLNEVQHFIPKAHYCLICFLLDDGDDGSGIVIVCIEPQHCVA